jgi:hypothetical protein
MNSIVKEKQYIVDREFFGKEFLIKDSLPNYNWKMEGESKQIGNYMCFKATAVVKANESDFRNFRFRNRDKKEEDKKEEDKEPSSSSDSGDKKVIDISSESSSDFTTSSGIKKITI